MRGKEQKQSLQSQARGRASLRVSCCSQKPNNEPDHSFGRRKAASCFQSVQGITNFPFYKLAKINILAFV